MLKPILEKRKLALQCAAEYRAVCMSKFDDGMARRNEYIDRLADAIRKGKVLRAGQ